MAWEDVEHMASKNINALIYDPDSQELLCEFKNGKVYRYSGVTGEMAAGFAQAPSATDHLKSVIQPMTEFRAIK